MSLRDVAAQRIGDTRRRRGITQRALAELIGRSERWLSQVERGQVDLAISDLERLAARLQVDVSFLLDSGNVATTRSVSSSAVRQIAPQFGGHQSRETHTGTKVGAVWFPWVVAGYGPYRPEHIVSRFHDAEPRYPDDVEAVFDAVRARAAEIAAADEWHLADFNGYKLLRFHAPARAHRGDARQLVLHFAPTTRYRALVTDQSLDEPMIIDGRTTTLRQRYASSVDLRVRPVPELATLWGVALTVITSDGLLLLSEGGNVGGTASVVVPPVATEADRLVDAAVDGAPDHFLTAKRGLYDHLGIDLQPSQLTWLSIGASSVLCDYTLVGRADTHHSYDEIVERRSLGVAPVGWKTTVHAVEFTPRAVAEFCSRLDASFSAMAVAAVVHALMSEFGVAKVEEAFGRVSLKSARSLPGRVNRSTDTI